MSIVYCSANHSPEQLFSWMNQEFDLDSQQDFTVVPFNKKLNPKKVRTYKQRIVLLSYHDAMRNFEFFLHPAFKNRQFFVFAPPYRCAEIGNSVRLDFQDDAELPGISYRMLGWNNNFYNPDTKATARQHEPVFKVNEGYQTKVINQIKSVGSIFSGLMTLIYSLPKRQMQKPVTHALCLWLYEGQSKEDLDNIIEALRMEQTITKRKAEKFHELLLGENGQKAQAACELIREQRAIGKNPDYKSIGRNIGIHAYDLRYIMRIVRTDEEYSELENVTIPEFYDRNAAKEAARKAAQEEKAAREAEEALLAEEKTKTKPKRVQRAKVTKGKSSGKSSVRRRTKSKA